MPGNQWAHIAGTSDVNAAGNDTTFHINGNPDSKEYGSAVSTNTSPFRIG
jgi:hypothetical protein